LVAVAVHAGHDLRPEIEASIAIDAMTRRREEDPHTDVLTSVGDIALVVHRSRFEVDLNRPRSDAIYRIPEQAWGHVVWKARLPPEVEDRSLQLYDGFYTTLARGLDALATNGRFVVLDVHSYNHRRQGPNAPPAPMDSDPEVNVGTGSLDRTRWGPLVDRFIHDLGAREACGHRLDVRENVRFRGGQLSRWVNERYPGAGCALALEFKKTFMNEWTDAVDRVHLKHLAAALEAVGPGVREALEETS